MAQAQKPDTAPPKPENQAKPEKESSPWGALFTKKETPKPDAGPHPDTEVADMVSNAMRRLRMIENRYDNMRRKLQFLEQNMLEQHKKLNTELKTTNMDVVEIKRGFLELQNRMRMLIKEVQLRADKEDVEVIKKYLDFWEPVKFVTREQVEEILDRRLGVEHSE